MQGFIVFTALLACAAAAPGLLLAHETPVVAAVHAAPVVHAAVPVVGAKTTITKSSQVVNHGAVVAPVVVKTAVPVVHAAPVVTAVHTPVVHAVHTPVVHAVHTPVVIKTAPAAIAHSSSVVHHGAVVKAVPLVAVH
ncbi:cuticle protein LPCP-23 [Papilio machaon]|uniref:cuticle protein LPCP-23 n=1 Tax=Papilio machaon TaxID=76193 RepID=UPI001E6653A4|nr:cuticle protein LPCP-23 [Papilio machaon]